MQVLNTMYTSAILKQDGSVWMVGVGILGEFGNCRDEGANRWTRVATDVVDIGRGYHHFYLVKRDGSLWTSGDFSNFATGPDNPKAFATLKSTRIIAGDVVHAESAYNDSTTFLKRDGTLWYMGYNTYYQAGIGEGTKQINAPVQVDSDVASFEARDQGLMYVKRDESLWMTGRINNTHLASLYPVGPYGGGVKTTPGGRPLKIADGVVQGTRKGAGLVYLKTDGTVWAAGKDPAPAGCGMFGRGTTTAQKTLATWTQLAPAAGPIAKVSWSTDGMHLLAQNGTAYAAGCNSYGTLGTGDASPKSAFTAVGTNVVQMDGDLTEYLLLNNGTLWATGYNGDGQYSNGTLVDSYSFVQSTY